MRELLSDAWWGLWRALIIAPVLLAVIAVAVMAVQWLYTEWWISQHCTMVLGTRVCK